VTLGLLRRSRSSRLDKPSLGGHFLGKFDSFLFFFCLFDALRLFLEDDFNVCGLTGVLSDASVCSVGTTTSGRRPIDLCMGDDELFLVESLGFGVCDGVGEQVLVDGGCLDGPSSLVSGGVALLGHALASDASGELDKGDDGLVLQDFVQVFHGRGHLHALGVVRNLAAVLEVHPEVRPAGLAGLFGDFGFDRVADHAVVLGWVDWLSGNACWTRSEK